MNSSTAAALRRRAGSARKRPPQRPAGGSVLLVPVTWQDHAWRPEIVITARTARLKAHHTSFFRRPAASKPQFSRSNKHLLRHIIL